jgi:hypothetical protein
MQTTRCVFVAAMYFLLHFSNPLYSQGYIDSKDKSCKFYTTSNVERRTFTYNGSCVNGYVEGKATVTLFQDGSFYWVATANFDKGILNGKGTQNFHNGHKYEGEFVNGNRSYGTYTFDDGRVYVGGYDENGKFSGKGTYTWPNGQKYEGNFKNEQYHGYGIFYYTSGNRYEGFWEAGARHGKAKYYFANGDRFEGVYSNGTCPAGIMYYKNGTTANGSFAYNEFTPDAPVTKTITPQKQNTQEAIIFNSSEEAEAYLDKNYFATPLKIENGYWVNPFLMGFNDEDFLGIMRCEGKTLEKYFVEENEEELEKALTVLEEDPYLIYWHEIKSITVAKDEAGEYWLTIKAPVMNQYDELQKNEIKLWVKEESRENVKNALLYLQKSPVKAEKTAKKIETVEPKKRTANEIVTELSALLSSIEQFKVFERVSGTQKAISISSYLSGNTFYYRLTNIDKSTSQTYTHSYEIDLSKVEKIFTNEDNVVL